MNSVAPPLFERLEAVLRDAAGIVAQMRASAQAEKTTESTSELEYLSVKQLANRIPYKEHTIRNLISAGEFREGIHYYKRRGRVNALLASHAGLGGRADHGASAGNPAGSESLWPFAVKPENYFSIFGGRVSAVASLPG